MLPCSEVECNNYVWISIVCITTQNISYQLDCALYYKIRQTILLILRPVWTRQNLTSKRYNFRYTLSKFKRKTVLSSGSHGCTNSKAAALIITLAKNFLSPLAAPLCTGGSTDREYTWVVGKWFRFIYIEWEYKIKWSLNVFNWVDD